MKYLKILILLLVFFVATAFKIAITNPNLRPFKIYFNAFNGKESEKIYTNVLNNFKLLPNFEIINSKDGSDYEVTMTEEGSVLNTTVNNSKTGEFFNLKLKSFNTDPISNANLLSDRIYEKITQTKGIFSTKIVFSMNWQGIKQIFLSDFTGKSLKKLTNNKKDSIAPKISHNKRYIVYTQYLQGAGTALRLIDLETFHDKLIFSSKEINIAGGFDKDDKKLFFANFDGKQSRIYEINLSDLTKKELYRSRARMVSPVTNFSDDGVAFVSDEYGSPQIFLLNKKDNKIKRISQSPAYATSPSFTIHGTHFAYIGQTNGKGNIYITSTDGTDFVALTHNLNNYDDPVWLANERFVLTHIYKDGHSEIILIDIPTQHQIKLYKVPAKISYVSAY